MGGIGHIWGGIIGAIMVTIIYDLTRDYYQYQLVDVRHGHRLTVLYMPRGIGGLIDQYLVKPALHRDPAARSPDAA